MRCKTALAVTGAYILAAAPMAMAAEHHQVIGEVSRVDASAKTLVIKEHGAKSGKEMTFTLASDAKVLEGYKSKSLADLKVGEQVRVSYADEGSKHEADRINLLPGKTAQAAPMKKKATQ